jgi:hypothetical protein
MEAASLAVAIAIAPTETMTPRATPFPAPAPPASEGEGSSPNEETAPSSSPEASKHSRRGPSAILFIGGLGTWGALPGVAWGADLGGGFRWTLAAVRFGVRYDIPTDITLSSGRIVAQELLGQAAVCLGRRWGFGCAGVSLGALWAEGVGLARSRKAFGLAAFAFTRLGAALPVNRRLTLQLYAELTVPMVRQRLLELNTNHQFWRTPPVGVAWGMSLVVNLFDRSERQAPIIN